MKKFLLLTLVFCITILTNVSAQTALLDSKFDGTLDGWSVYDVTGPQTWIPNSFGDREYAYINGFDNGPQDNEDWLISPALDLTQYADEVLTFENAANFDGPDLEFFYSTDYDGSSDPNGATWNSLTGDVTWSPGDYEFVESEIDLSGIEGSSVYFAFKYISNQNDGAKLFEIDNFLIEADFSSSVFDLEKLALISQPVVANGLLQFEILNPSQELTFGIFDLNGRSLQSRTIQPMTSDVKVPTAQFSTGMYLLVVRAENVVKTFKFTVTH